MEITPNDIRNADFAVSMRGYDKQEVKKYLDQVASALEKIKQDHLRQSMEIESLKAQLNALRSFEDTIKSAAIDARRNADMTIASAKRDAEQILASAHKEAEKAMGDRATKMRDIERQLESLELTKQSYVGKVRMLLQSHLDMVEEIASHTQPLSSAASLSVDEFQVTDSSEITSKSRESFATVPSKPKALHIEEANAVGSVVSAKPTAGLDAPQQEVSLDPELAAALEQYVHHGGIKHESEQTTYSRSSSASSTQFQSTGFAQNGGDTDDLGDGVISPVTEMQGMGSNLIKFEELGKPMSSSGTSQLGPDSLAAELDRVVAKFEEEIAKAEKNT